MRKAYTATGDDGYTKDFAGNRIPKDDIRIGVGGKIDFLQAAIDLAILKGDKQHAPVIEWIQRKLWQAAGEVGRAGKECIIDPITEQDLKELEDYIDSLGEPPERFIRFNTEKAIIFNECRIRCRELETHLVKLLRENQMRPVVYKWINRLSSLFYMLGYKAASKESQ